MFFLFILPEGAQGGLIPLQNKNLKKIFKKKNIVNLWSGP